MARERVQVQGLGDAVPGIQPTIQRGGQYAVQVQRAGRNKLQDLAGALSQINPLLEQYAGVAEQEAQMFEEELSRKSPEEIQAMLQKTEGELDKQVRRGAMGWLTSPLNQKRKMQAVGALLHDDYERQLKARVQDPANADANINELIAGVKNDLRNQYGSLQSTFVNEGFEGAIRETTRRYTLHHDTLATTQAREEVKRAGKSVLFNASTLVNNEIADPESINEWWSSNEGSLIPSELSALRKEVIVLHASRGNFEAARKFQEYTANFKAGTTKMGDPETAADDVFGMYSAEEAKLTQTLDDMELASDDRLVADSKLELREYDELINDIGRTLRNEGSYTSDDGTVKLNTLREAEDYVLEEMQKSDNILVRGSSGVSLVQKGLKVYELPSDENFISLKENYARATTGPMSFNFRYKQVIEKFNQSVTTIDNLGKSIVDPRYTKLSVDLLVDMARKRDAKHLEVSTGTFTDVEGNTVVNSKFQQQLPYLQAWDDFYLKEYERELKEETKVLKPKVELAETPGIEEGTTGMSFIEPTEKLSDLYGFGLKGTQRKAQLAMGFAEFTDLEQVMRLGGDTDEIIKKLDERGKIEEALNTIQSNKATLEEQQTAQRKIALYTLAQGLYTAQNIKNGSVPIKFGGTPSDTVRMTFKQAQQKGYKDVTRTGFGGVGAIVRLPATEPITKNIRIDKQALKKLAGVYPLIPKERLIEISATEPEEFPEEKSLYEAIYDVELEEGTELDEKLLKDFIIKQNELSQGIYKK